MRKSHSNNKKLNNYLIRKALKAKGVLLDLKASRNSFTVAELKEVIEKEGVEKNEEEEQKEEIPDFFEYAEEIIKDYKPRISHQRWKGI